MTGGSLVVLVGSSMLFRGQSRWFCAVLDTSVIVVDGISVVVLVWSSRLF